MCRVQQCSQLLCALSLPFFLLVCVFAGFRCCSQSAVVVSQVRERLLILLGLFHFFALCSFLFNIFTFLYLFESLNALNARIYLSIYLCWYDSKARERSFHLFSYTNALTAHTNSYARFKRIKNKSSIKIPRRTHTLLTWKRKIVLHIPTWAKL